MDNNIDDKLREMAQNSHISMPENFENDMDRLVKQLCAESRRVKVRNHFRKMVLIPMCGILFTSAGVCAAVNYRYQRMEAMSYDERIAYVHELQSTDIQADSYNRDLTEKEKKRLDILKKEYSLYGKFPTSELLRLANNKWVVSNKLCFVSTTSTFYFPDRQMNDEELLQLIDFYYKRDYSIYSYASAKKTEVFQEASKISEDEAVEIGIDRIKDIFGEDVSGYKTKVNKSNSNLPNENSTYNIKFSENEKWYRVTIEADNGAFYELFEEVGDEISHPKGIAINNEIFYKCAEKIKDKWIGKIFNYSETCDIYMTYDIDNKTNTLEDGTISYIYVMPDDRAFLFGYSLGTDTIFQISHIDNFKQYEKAMDKDNKELQKNDISRVKISLTK